MNKPLLKSVVPVLFASVLLGCVATAAQWMATVAVNPDNLNEALLDGDGNVVHVSNQADGLHITRYDADGNVAVDALAGVAADDTNGAIDLPGQRLLVVGATLATSTVVDASAQQVLPIDSAMVPVGVAERPLAGAVAVLGQTVAAFGNASDQGWILVMDFATGSSQLLEVSGAVSITSVSGHNQLMTEVATASGRQVVSFDTDLNELGRYDLTNSRESLIGESLGRPALYNSSNHNVRLTDVVGVTQWEYENAEFEYIKGQSVGPDGRVLLWGDNSRFNPLSSVAEDKAHFLLIDTDGQLLYHYLGGSAMARTLYTHVKQFENGVVQVSYQGWSGELSGFILGSNLATPFTVTRKVFHDYITLAGNKSRWMREPTRVETYSQCGSFCINLVLHEEGHCDNLDVFNIGTDSLISVSQVCGAVSEGGALLPNTVKVSLY